MLFSSVKYEAILFRDLIGHEIKITVKIENFLFAIFSYTYRLLLLPRWSRGQRDATGHEIAGSIPDTSTNFKCVLGLVSCIKGGMQTKGI